MIKKRKKFIEDFNNNLNKYKNNLPINIKNKSIVYETDSCFLIERFSCKNKNYSQSNTLNYPTKIVNEVINCKKIKMVLNSEQILIFDKWFNAYTEMYNESLNYIRNNCNFFKNNIIRSQLKNTKLKEFTNFQKIRNKLKSIKNNIQQKSIYKGKVIRIHTLDYAIKQLTSNIKSSISNLKNGNIKRFRLKFWKNNRPSKTIELEKEHFTKGKLSPTIFGEIKYLYNNKDYKLSEINHNVKVNYNSIKKEYTLLIPITNKTKEIENKSRNIIVLDPGLRTFMTGLSECEQLNIGININKILRDKIKRLNKIRINKNIPNKIKKKNEILINRKIYNTVDEIHWKTINFLIRNFRNILLGDMSAKSIVSRNKSVLSNNAKVACLRTRYYQFQQRLKYKCQLSRTNYRLVNECYTSKICSNCGYYKEDLKGEKRYHCNKCNISLDRDINGCRNIMIKSLMK